MTDVRDIAGASQEDLRAGTRLASAIRELANAAVCARPGAHSANAAATVERVSEQLAVHAVTARRPWTYTLDQAQRAAVTRAVSPDGANNAGTSWTSFAPFAPPLNLLFDGETSVGRVTLGPAFSGPPGRVHGGTVATLLDHAMGALLFHLGRTSFTARLEVDYLGASPLDTELEVRAWAERIEGRKTYVGASISVAGEVSARGLGLFVTVAPEGQAEQKL